MSNRFRFFFTTMAACLGLTGCVTAGAQTSSDTTTTQRASLAVAQAAETYDASGPGAAYVISKDGVIIAAGGVGLADLEWNLKNTADTVFRLGSISKSVTAVAVLELVEDGRLDLDRAIAAYAPDLPEPMGAVTLRQLMSHRSGLAEHVWNPDILPFVWQPVTTQQMVDLQKDFPPDFPPGEKYDYVNFNYLLVAHIVERITGQTFVEFINDYFERHAMPQSHYDWHDAIIPHRAEFYDQKDGAILNSQEVDLTHVSASGALMSSAKDMARWASLLADHQLISKASLDEAWSAAALPDGTPTTYGLGFNVGEINDQEMIWHNGLTPGSQAAFGLVPDEALFVAVLSNGFYLPNATKLMEAMMTIMLTGELPLPQEE